MHTGSKVHIIGPGTVTVANHIIRDTEVGPRDPAGGVDTIQLGRSSDEECNIGDVCKYVNLQFEVGPRFTQDLSIGWIEWAFVCKRESDTDPVNTNLSTQTLQDVCKTYFRNECVYTGSIPVGANQANSQEAHIKIPQPKIKMHWGDQWKLYLYARTTNSVQTGTNTFVVWTTFSYRNYH